MLIRALFIVAASASAASAQVIYAPTQIQYGGQNPYYYAGNDPAVHAAARFPSAPGAAWGRVPGYAFVGPNRAVVQRNVRVYTDAFGTLDARPWGLTPDNVANEANARLPRYVRKADLMAGAGRGEGMKVVRADAVGAGSSAPRGSIAIRPNVPAMYRSGPLLPLPRGQGVRPTVSTPPVSR